MKLKDKVAVITGAGRGIGLATAKLFLAEGAKVVAVDKNADSRHELMKDGAKPDDVLFVAADVSRREDVKAMVEMSMGKFGRIDILFNNAGIGISGAVDVMTEEEWDLVMDVNVKGQYLCCHFVLPHMKKQGGGVIVNMSSVLGFAALPENAAYCAAKSAALGFTRSLALDVARENIRVNAIVPGSIDTPYMWQGLTPEEKEVVAPLVAETKPMGRVGEPVEIAKAVLFLSSDDSSFATGAPFIVDGGLLAKLATIR